MKKIFIIILFISFYSFTFSAFSKEEVYYCIEEDSSGYIYENGSWERTEFKVQRFKALIDLEESTFESLDKYMDDISCSPSDNYLILSCIDSVGSSFAINKKNLHFTKSHSFGYIIHDKVETIVDTIYFSYGKCELF